MSWAISKCKRLWYQKKSCKYREFYFCPIVKHWKNGTDRGNRSTQRKTCPNATFSTTNPKWPGVAQQWRYLLLLAETLLAIFLVSNAPVRQQVLYIQGSMKNCLCALSWLYPPMPSKLSCFRGTGFLHQLFHIENCLLCLGRPHIIKWQFKVFALYSFHS